MMRQEKKLQIFAYNSFAQGGMSIFSLFTYTFLEHHYSGNCFSWETYAGNICSIFYLCMESNALEKSTNKMLPQMLDL